MRKIVIISILLGFGVNAFALTQERRIELLENAVVKLIKENQALKNEINNLAVANKINTQMIFKLNNKLSKINNTKSELYAKVTAVELNVREKPTIHSKVVSKLKKGDLVKIKKAVLNKNTIWYKIDNGYISSAFTELVYGDKIKKEKITALKFVLQKIVKAKPKPKENKILKPTKVKLISIPPKPKEKENNKNKKVYKNNSKILKEMK